MVLVFVHFNFPNSSSQVFPKTDGIDRLGGGMVNSETEREQAVKKSKMTHSSHAQFLSWGYTIARFVVVRITSYPKVVRFTVCKGKGKIF